jgi:isocitrate dehydrogenase|tara:strand:+ start:228 stop:482 length:255 start_codon:yes stop_codon:yes gene_type:complete
MSEKKEIKPRLFKVTAGERYYDKYFVIAYTANDALQMVMDQFARAQDYALNIQSVECLNWNGDYQSDIMISPECIQGGLQNKII